MRDVILTGFMGTGKSTVGKILARRYGLSYIDTDEEIALRAGKPVYDILKNEGESAFRRLEREVLAGLGSGQGRVVATGGGALLTPESRALLDPQQIVICFTCAPAELERRLAGTRDRPLLDPVTRERIDDLLAQRSAAYSVFEQIDTTGRSAEAVADEVAGRAGLSVVADLTFTPLQTSRVLVAEGLLDTCGTHLRECGIQGRAFVITDDHVAAHAYSRRLSESLLGAGYEVAVEILPAGEEFKTVASLDVLYRAALSHDLQRGDTVVGLGGGVIGDVAGMLAATYMRGIRLVLVPTTLLAQVDAAIGGKVGVDLDAVKNLVGAFHPAELVLIDSSSLLTLNPSHLSQGLAEIVKIAMMRCEALLSAVESLPSPEGVVDRVDIIRAAAREKARLVQQDPYESGERMLLNFGHTVGHAIEAVSGYRLAHGEAVSIGMVAELRLGVRQGWSAPALLPSLIDLLRRLGLPIVGPALDPESVARSMAHDKKRSGGSIPFALPVTRGHGGLFDVPMAAAREAIQYALGGIAV